MKKTKSDNRKFGDLVLWKQILNIAKELKKDVILITDERKADWWWKSKNGKIIGPRPELVDEIKREANVNFHMYSSEGFVSYGQQFFNEKLDEKAVDEITSIKTLDDDNLEHYDKIRDRLRSYRFKRKMFEIQDKISSIELKIKYLNNKRNSTFIDESNPMITQKIIDKYNEGERRLMNTKNNLLNELEVLKDYQFSIKNDLNMDE